MDEKIELPVRFQEIPDFDQTTQAVVQLAAEVREDEIFYPIAVIDLPEEDANSEMADKSTDSEQQTLPISDDGTTTVTELVDAGFEVC